MNVTELLFLFTCITSVEGNPYKVLTQPSSNADASQSGTIIAFPLILYHLSMLDFAFFPLLLRDKTLACTRERKRFNEQWNSSPRSRFYRFSSIQLHKWLETDVDVDGRRSSIKWQLQSMRKVFSAFYLRFIIPLAANAEKAWAERKVPLKWR